MKIGIVCYASLGGSGIVATELAYQLAARGHDVHLISTDPPFRLRESAAALTFHRVSMLSYPLFREPQYLLALSNSIVNIARAHDLDIVHAHYAVPHATAAYLARQILVAAGARAPKLITTLHGTDITLVGSDPSYTETVAFCIDEGDGVTAVSESLKADTYRSLPVHHDIEVIPNFLDCEEYRRINDPGLRERLCPSSASDHLVMHASNFRPVKRLDLVIEVFRRIRRELRARLLLVGDGPDLDQAREALDASGLSRDAELLGQQKDIIPILSVADLFLLPSAQESFGLAALEAMACEVPVIASRVGGLPEVIVDGVGGYLHGLDDLDGMAQSAIKLLTDRALHREVGRAGAEAVHERFCAERIVPRYEAFYRTVLERSSQ